MPLQAIDYIECAAMSIMLNRTAPTWCNSLNKDCYLAEMSAKIWRSRSPDRRLGVTRSPGRSIGTVRRDSYLSFTVSKSSGSLESDSSAYGGGGDASGLKDQS